MSKKIEELQQLSLETASQVAESGKNWKDFLGVCAPLYKYSFRDKLLIYAQKSTASACAELVQWNKLDRRVKSGTKGIALPYLQNGYTKLRYVFDVADTYPVKGANSPPIWKLTKENLPSVFHQLEKSYGTVLAQDTVKKLMNYVKRVVIQDWSQIYPALQQKEVGNSTEKDSEWEYTVRKIIIESMQYITLVRCGIRAENYFSDRDFEDIKRFQNSQLFYGIGAVIHHETRRFLQNVVLGIKNYSLEKGGLSHETKQTNFIRRETGNHVSSRGGLPDTRLETERTEIRRTVRQNETRIHERTRGSTILTNAAGGHTERLSGESSRTSTGTDRAINGTDGTKSRNQRGTQGEKSNEMGTRKEQFASNGGGNRQRGDTSRVEQKNLQITTAERIENFRITDENLGIGGAKAKFENNLTAIQTLQKIEAENRRATPEEQEILSQYVGWGGLPQAFDEKNEKWAKEYHKLKSTLTEKEYQAARKSTLNAHYTSPVVIQAIYQALQQTDLQKGRILEPSCGIGHFFGLLPEDKKEFSLYGVELDSITGRIAQKLYPKANISIMGFENTNFPDNYFDIAVGNVPFGSYKVADSRYDAQNLYIHDYFITKTLDLVRTDGIAALIVTKGVLDKENTKARESLAQKADLLAAVRLPNTAFQQNAGTEVTADILFLRKREVPPEKLPDWVQIRKDENGLPINSYFCENPSMILGKMEFWKNRYGNQNETACLPLENSDLKELLQQAISKINLPKIPVLEKDISLQENVSPRILSSEEEKIIKNFSYTILDNELYYRENQFLKPIFVNDNVKDRIKSMIAIRDITRNLLDIQVNNCTEEELKQLQSKLHTEYDKFQSNYGLLNAKANKKAFSEDTSYPLLCSLEILNEEKTELKQKADIFYKRTIQPYVPITHVDTAQDALIVSLNEKANVDLEYMSQLTNQPKDNLLQDLRGMIFKNPLSEDSFYDGWETADQYLSGNVREKLRTAEQAAEKNSLYEINVERLKEVQPKELSASEIEVRLGASWIDVSYYQQFMYETFDTPIYYRKDFFAHSAKTISVEYADISNRWLISGKSLEKENVTVTKVYGTSRINAYEILEKTLNMQDIVVKDVDFSENKKIYVVNEKETLLGQEKQEQIQNAFQKWIWKEPERRKALCQKYNELFNCIRPREYDGSHLIFAGINPEITLRTHQQNAVAPILYGKNTLLAHVMGAGKTFTMIASAMEGKRIGLHRKAFFVVPNHFTEQWASDFLRLYPNTNL